MPDQTVAKINLKNKNNNNPARASMKILFLRLFSLAALFMFTLLCIVFTLAITTELLILFPPNTLDNILTAYPQPIAQNPHLFAPLTSKLNLYLHATYHFWPLWLAGLLGAFISHLLMAFFSGTGRAKNYMARIHILEQRAEKTNAELTEQTHIHQALLDRIEALYAKSPEAYLLINPAGNIDHANAAALRFFKTLHGEDCPVIGRLIKNMMPSFTTTGLERLFEQIIAKKAVWQGEIQLQDTNIWLSLRIIYASEHGVIFIFRNVSQDHTPSADLKTSDALVQQILSDTPEPLAVLNPDWDIARTSPAFAKLFNQSPRSLLGKPITDILTFERWSDIKSDLQNGTSFAREEEKITLNSKEIWVKWRLSCWKDATGEDGGYLLFMEDITELHNTRNRAQTKENTEHALAYQDALTGLPNRQLFNDRFNMALTQAYRQLGKVALLFLDLDGFKAVNDTLGHDAGDTLLQNVATRLKSCVRDTDTVARLGGDEFTIILGIREPKDADIVAKKIIDAINQPYTLNGKEAHVSTSIGIAIYPLHGEGAADLMRKADTAMYAAKTSGKNQYIYYTEDLDNTTEPDA